MSDKVYVVFYNDYDGGELQGAFSTRERAEAYVAERQQCTSISCGDIEEVIVDAELDKKALPYWLARLDKRDITFAPSEMPSGSGEYRALFGTEMVIVENSHSYITAMSAVSEEHAKQVCLSAVEKGFKNEEAV